MNTKTLTIAGIVALLGALAPAANASPLGLRSAQPCADQPGFTCTTLTVPADHSGRVTGTMDLQVGAADNTDAPVLLFLMSGGEPGVPALTRLKQRLPELASQYRFVAYDQRGSGANAIDCPAVQSSPLSNLIPGPPEAIAACGRSLGDRAGLFGTDQTVADIEALRLALHADKVVLDGLAYGTFVAERYAIAHPRQVSRMVLDTPVPHKLSVADSFYLEGWPVHARVLREACAVAPACGFDPAADLATLAARTTDGLKLAHAISAYGFADPTYRNVDGFKKDFGDLPSILHAAVAGDTAKLTAVIAGFQGSNPVRVQSKGLSTATLCTDQRQPWGTAATPSVLRQPALTLAQTGIPARAVWPYTPEIAGNPGFIKNCQFWPPVQPTSNPDAPLPNIPILMLSGANDLFIPTEFARKELACAPSATLTVVPGAHALIQQRELGRVGRDAVNRFLL